MSTQKKIKTLLLWKEKKTYFKSQVVVDKKSKKIICTAFTNGKCHDFGLFKESKTCINLKVRAVTDTGYQGLKKIHANSELTKKKTRKNPLTQEDKKNNQMLASERMLNENVIGSIKRFKIISDRYRNRRKRYHLRFNLIAAIHNLEIE